MFVLTHQDRQSSERRTTNSRSGQPNIESEARDQDKKRIEPNIASRDAGGARKLLQVEPEKTWEVAGGLDHTQPSSEDEVLWIKTVLGAGDYRGEGEFRDERAVSSRAANQRESEQRARSKAVCLHLTANWPRWDDFLRISQDQSQGVPGAFSLHSKRYLQMKFGGFFRQSENGEAGDSNRGESHQSISDAWNQVCWIVQRDIRAAGKANLKSWGSGQTHKVSSVEFSLPVQPVGEQSSVRRERYYRWIQSKTRP